MNSISYEEAVSFDEKSTNESHLQKIDTSELERNMATLARLHNEHFPDAEEKERRNFQERAEALKNRLNP